MAAGHGVVAPEVTRRLLSAFVAASPAAEPPRADLDQLTAREREVLAGLGQGLSNADLATRLGITEATAKTHVSRVLAQARLHLPRPGRHHRQGVRPRLRPFPRSRGTSIQGLGLLVDL